MTVSDLMALPRRCRAHNRSGSQCGLAPTVGATVCKWHGGAAPQVRAKAEERIRALVDPALDRLAKLLEDQSSGVALGAVKDVLDRAGYVAKQQVEVTMRQHAEKMAADLGLDPEELIAAAEAIVGNDR